MLSFSPFNCLSLPLIGAHQTVGKYLLFRPSGPHRAQEQTWKYVVGGAFFDHRAHLGLKPRLTNINADTIV